MAALAKLRRDLKELKSAQKAKILQRFFKTGKGEYGEGDIFLGIMVPQQRQLVKKYWRDISLRDLDKLIKSKFHEERLVALLILVEKYKKIQCHSESLEGRRRISKDPSLSLRMTEKQIFQFYLSHTRYINNWDLVDLSAPKIVGAYLADKNRAILYKLASSKDLWQRRIAVLATFEFIRRRDFTDSLRIAKMLLKDKHDLIHKAVGWMLREIGKRDETVLINFLNQHLASMPRTMLRYAIERFHKEKRLKYLAA
ncbi:DNA alkylation repair protein [bacterium]|nr:MAG: DNA alkylation repair protein [bacterium]